MTIETLLVFLDTAYRQNPLMYFLLSLLCKSSLVILAAVTVSLMWRSLSASNRSVLWLTTVVAVLLLPLFGLLLPALEVSFPVPVDLFTTNVMHQDALSAVDPLWIRALLAIYLAGVILSLLYLVHGYIRLHRISCSSQIISRGRAWELLNDLKSVHGVSNAVTLLAGAGINSPFTWGVYRHRILLPQAALGWDRGLLCQVLSHELGHIQRKDWLFHLLARLARILYWPNPLIWAAVNSLSLESEKACDDAAIDDGGCSVSYADNLLRIACGLRASPQRLGMGMFSRGSKLSQRIQHILAQQKNRSFLRADEISVVLGGVLMVCLPLAALRFSPEWITPVTFEPITIPVSMEDFNRNPRHDPVPGSESLPSPEWHGMAVPIAADIGLQTVPAKLEAPASNVIARGSHFELDTLNREVFSAEWESAPLHAPMPGYPLRARQRGIEGYVTAEIKINDTGRVLSTTIMESVPFGTFDQSVLAAVNEYVYCPEVHEGMRGKEKTLQLKFRFSLQENL
ncbi:MAG: TonB family protein [Pseudohongiellaceae bacterium]